MPESQLAAVANIVDAVAFHAHTPGTCAPQYILEPGPNAHQCIQFRERDSRYHCPAGCSWCTNGSHMMNTHRIGQKIRDRSHCNSSPDGEASLRLKSKRTNRRSFSVDGSRNRQHCGH